MVMRLTGAGPRAGLGKIPVTKGYQTDVLEKYLLIQTDGYQIILTAAWTARHEGITVLNIHWQYSGLYNTTTADNCLIVKVHGSVHEDMN